MAQNILFYSDRCELSKRFMNELHKAPNSLWDTFLKINVDTHRHKVPQIIKVLPTIIVNNYPKPVETTACMTWLHNMIKTLNPNAAATINSEIDPYMPNEMGTAFTDSFAFIDLNAPDEKKLFSGTKQTFSYFDDENANKMISPSDVGSTRGGSSSGGKQKQTEIDQRLEEFQKQRMKDSPQGQMRI
jgi:hypothetical protein